MYPVQSCDKWVYTRSYLALKKCYNYVPRLGQTWYIQLCKLCISEKSNAWMCMMFSIEPTTSCIPTNRLYHWTTRVNSLVIRMVCAWCMYTAQHKVPSGWCRMSGAVPSSGHDIAGQDINFYLPEAQFGCKTLLGSCHVAPDHHQTEK
jgi:hypothetical protein